MAKETKINIPIMFCFDKNYVIPAAVAFYSLMENANKNYNYTFYILHSDIEEKQEIKLKETIKEFKNCKLEFLNMNNRLEEFWKTNYKGGHFSKEVMYKLLVASLFPKLDKIIVSDVDVVFLNDISESFFQLDTKEDIYIAGVQPIGKISNYLNNYKKQWNDEEINKMGEICGGYLVMNLKKIREDNMEEIFLKSLEENGYRLNQMEQDIFNITCHGHIKKIHLKYVACSYMWDYYLTDNDMKTDKNYTKKEIMEAMNNTVQLHYATSTKPWKNPDCTKSEIWYMYLCKTPFLKEFLDKLPMIIAIPVERMPKSFIKKIIHGIKYLIRATINTIRNPKVIFTKEFYEKIKTKSKKLLKK